MTRRAAASLCALALLGATSPARARNPWTQAGHVRIGVVRTLDSLNPLLSGQAASTDLAQFLFDGLIRYDDAGNAIPDAATAVPTRANGGISADGKTITYHLRRDLRFSDGVPLRAEDVVYTYRQDVNPHNNVPYHFPYDLPTSVTATDPYTVVVRLKAPSAPFVASFFRCGAQGVILPKHLLANVPDFNRAPFNTHPVGSGPFMVERYDINSTLEMVPNPYWFGGKPGLKRVTYRIIPSENTLLVALRTHEIDFYFGAPEQQYAELRSLPHVSSSAAPSQQYEMVAFNARREPFSDVRVRRAAAKAIDWKNLAATTYLNVDLADWGDIFPKSWAYPNLPDPNPFDLARARALLDEAGWQPGPDGIRTKNGKRLEVTLSTVAGVMVRENAEVALQSQLHAAGFDVQVRNAPANMLFAPYGAGGLLATGKFDLGIYAWTKNPDPDDTQTTGPGYIPPHGANYAGIVDPEMGRLQLRASAVYERGPRRAIYAQLERRFGELLFSHTIVWRANINAWNDDLHGVKPAVAVSDFWNVADWSI
ncbi:ABC transporter substrate-binding protein [Vulcanimicrobium alpinum]|uniref:ABC transporter substrate-binding protein n=1 Tax=Vulcanimicrobium alpinum TaxID=3016050 RepID=A0AAN1XV91_UNVUL|nr:peptide ABC transporter substrate-binding protein [Vulcanimicrobium alpinum]BDE04942.1 ABC transporter substrate-binding protein [Vulcanimicrobium alpinum]